MQHRTLQLALLVSTLIVGASTRVRADDPKDPKDEVLPARPTYKANDVNVTEKLGSRVPLDAKFRTHDGKQTTLGEVLSGELPTILTFNYADCPMLCSLQLNGLMAALPGVTRAAPDASGRDIAFRIGTQFRIVSISLEPITPSDPNASRSVIARTAKMREHYIERLPQAERPAARTGWTFLVGDAAEVRRVAEATGFAYVYIKERAEWAHPAALILLSAAGTVTRYVYGIELEPQVLRESIFKAGIAEPATAVGFMNRCYHFDPSASDHSRAGMMALRVGAAGFLVLLLACFGLYFVRRNSRRESPGEAAVS